MDPPDYSRCVLRIPQPTSIPETNSADPTERLPNYSIIHSPSFTFLVGPRHTKLTIQSALAQHVSKPLHNLMNNGHTRESRHRIAVLEEEDVETFVAFCEYAYTGDYKVPQAPVPREHRVSVAESVHSPVNTWRGTYRSSSMSSAVPPPAPSPPPEFVDNGQSKAETESIPQPQPKPEPEPETSSVIGEDPAAEAAAEATTGAEAEAGADAETGVVEEDKAPVESVEEPAEKKDDQPDETQEAEAEAGLSPLPEADEQAEPEPANDADDWASWPTEDKMPKDNSESKGKKGKRKDKKKKKNQLAAEEDVPANLTPPTTPPTNPVEMHELSLDNATEDPAEPVDPIESIKPESVAEQPAEITSPEEGPAETSPADAPAAEPEHAELEPPAEQDLEPMPETATQSVTPPQEEWEASNGDEQQANESWAEPGDGDQDQPATNEPIDPPKPVIDMSFAKQPDASPRTPGMSLWDEFATLRYNDEHQVTPTTLNMNVNDSPTDLPYLTFHAKVYVFATRYLIPA
ncbi:hypothetical protein N7481_011288 [Penicillium waksmanii]|uniref:uncharacterized protein n=1 Tax=Penicillium waksmanii TaxID=69791 RepID=UPI0025484546|nr:uncharacterized protein N7481_011288 [Penicillium waksmanii]KAJ5974078.1 hypothetical protein N7481_011288 [Penicillium waksmanii]